MNRLGPVSINTGVWGAAIAITIGCSSAPPPRNAVVMQVSEDESHVRLPAASVGEPVVCRRKYCQPDPAHGKTAERCDMRIVGHATIARVLGNEYSVAHRSKGECAEGDLVERAP